MSQPVSSPINSLAIRNILLALGAGFVLYKALSFTKTYLSNRPSNSSSSGNDLISRYGKNTWALITTSSEDSGRVLAIELAKQGFNIVLVGNDSNKLREIDHELNGAFPTTQTRTVMVDFLNSYTKGFAKQIFKQCQDLDISLIVNNVGAGQSAQYTNSTELTDKVVANCLSHVLITRTFLPKLAARSQRSCLVNIASFVSSCPKAALQPSASKVFYENFSKSLVHEHSNIDILSLQPAGASAKMMVCKELKKTGSLDSEQGAGRIEKICNYDEAQESLLSSFPNFLKSYTIMTI